MAAVDPVDRMRCPSSIRRSRSSTDDTLCSLRPRNCTYDKEGERVWRERRRYRTSEVKEDWEE